MISLLVFQGYERKHKFIACQGTQHNNYVNYVNYTLVLKVFFLKVTCYLNFDLVLKLLYDDKLTKRNILSILYCIANQCMIRQAC